MQISDASSISRLIPSRVPQQPKAPTATISQPQGLGGPAQPTSTLKAGFNVPPTAVLSPQTADLDTTLPPAGGQVAMSHSDPMKALMADWGKKDSQYDLNGDGTVDIKDMLELLKQMAEAPAQKETDPLQALLNDWGKSDSPHDLNGDGTVDIKDMLELLKQMAEAPTQEPIGPLQALLNEWGKSGSRFDLDGDGTVGMTDMLALLKKMADELAQSPPGDSGAEPTGTFGQTRLQQLIADWGKTDSKFDLDADGTVGIRDMLMLLAQAAQRAPESSPSLRHESNDRDDHFNRIRSKVAQYHRAAARHHARSIMPQIASMDPGEVRESIDRDSKIPTEQKRFVLGQIADWHPHGHQVSVVG